MDEPKEAEEYEATVKITVMATSPEEATEKINNLLEESETVVSFEYAEEDEQ